MMFTEFSIRDLKNSCAKNYSFFNARAVDTFAMSRKLDAKGKMIRVENYACNEDGADINVPNQRYSMNIYFAVDAGPTGPVTLVVDPDTGNGTGNEP
jgi:hypothetical protein